MNWSLAVTFMIPYFIMAVLGSIAAQTTNPIDGGAAVVGLIESTGNPNVSSTIGVTLSKVGLESEFSYFSQAKDFAKYFVDSAALNHSFLKENQFLNFIRYGLLLLTVPFVFMVVKESLELLSRMITGISAFGGAAVGLGLVTGAAAITKIFGAW
tara:strand:+ start:3417 stop:3881 length:465 start_codon:yes stop_codon:yes gene_type:complete